jgi:uncharacterized NAD(P)/FAD-binding protein YdhS
MREAWQARTNGPLFEHVCEEVTDIETEGGAPRYTWRPKNRSLWTGEFSHWATSHRVIRSSRTGWLFRAGGTCGTHGPKGVLAPLSRADNVILIGSGLTTIDLVVALYRRGHEGRIVAVSRHGLLPLAHRGFESCASFFPEIKDSKPVLDIFRTVRKHLDRAKAMGIDKRAVIDSLRADTQTVWLGIPTDEKRRFLRHLFRYWEIIRSRLPPESEAIIAAMRDSGQFNVIAGQIHDFVEAGAALEVHYIPRGRTTHEVERAALVINCIGPESNYSKVDHPLVRNLMQRGSSVPAPQTSALTRYRTARLLVATARRLTFFTPSGQR